MNKIFPAMLVMSSLLLNNSAGAQGIIGGAVEMFCGNCGLGKDLDKLHKDIGNPLDLPGHLSRESTVEVVGPLLAVAILASRNDARNAGTMPIPSNIRQQLERFYPADILNPIQYRVGQGHELSVQANSFRFGDAAAIALIDTIVFLSASDAENNDELWAHEVKHVEQYRRWGLEVFAKKYVRDHQSVEDEANNAQRQYASILPIIRPPPGPAPMSVGYPVPLPAPVSIPVRFCQTPWGACQIPPAMVPMGSPCFCGLPNGQHISGSAF